MFVIKNVKVVSLVYSFRNYNWFWIFVVGPHIGAILGVFIFRLLMSTRQDIHSNEVDFLKPEELERQRQLNEIELCNIKVIGDEHYHQNDPNHQCRFQKKRIIKKKLFKIFLIYLKVVSFYYLFLRVFVETVLITNEKYTLLLKQCNSLYYYYIARKKGRPINTRNLKTGT